LVARPGTVTAVSPSSVTVGGDKGEKTYPLIVKKVETEDPDKKFRIFPVKSAWQEPVVAVGQKVQRKELLAKGVTRIYFQANMWIFAFLVFLLGAVWGIGKAAVYKHIPDYFPDEVGVVGGMVGVLGGLGGFFCPILFGYLLKTTGLWTSCWVVMFVLSAASLWWMHTVIVRMLREKYPEFARRIESS
jgi:NNP family nitrate/nitrite transporter-like MFS transporter